MTERSLYDLLLSFAHTQTVNNEIVKTAYASARSRELNNSGFIVRQPSNNGAGHLIKTSDPFLRIQTKSMKQMVDRRRVCVQFEFNLLQLSSTEHGFYFHQHGYQGHRLNL